MGQKVVLDTNVFISALGWDAKPETCLERVLRGADEGYISPGMVEELRGVMEYPRFDFTPAERRSFVEVVLASFHVIEPTVELSGVSEDPDDDMVLECAVAGDVEFVISGDSHLRDLETFRGIAIVSPATYLDTVASDGSFRSA